MLEAELTGDPLALLKDLRLCESGLGREERGAAATRPGPSIWICSMPAIAKSERKKLISARTREIAASADSFWRRSRRSGPVSSLPGQTLTVACSCWNNLPPGDSAEILGGEMVMDSDGRRRSSASSAMKAAGRKIAALTAYDYPMGRLLDESGIDIILVGDSLGMVILGFPDTTSVTMEHMVHHCAAVARGVRNALVVADLPINSCATPGDALASSRRLVEAGAGAVKIEGARPAEIGAIVGAGIPLMAHLGMLPQRVREEGGYHVKGKTEQEASVLLDQARIVEAAGAFAVVLELVAADVASRISESLRIPTIGIGSGPGCDGQILVTHDLIGLFPWFRPRFAKPEADVAAEIRTAVRSIPPADRGSSVSLTARRSSQGQPYSHVRLVRRRTCLEWVSTRLTYR